MGTSDENRNSSPAKMPAGEGNFINSLARTLAAANRFLTLLLKEEGITGLVPSHGEILLHLFTKGTVSMQDLAAAIQRDPSTVTSLVRKLSDVGYVSTEKSPEDRRVTQVSLTVQGSALRASFERISLQLTQVQMEGVGKDAFQSTCTTLDHIRSNFEDACENRI